MSHAFMMLCGIAAREFFVCEKTDGYRFGMFALCVLSGLSALISADQG